MTLNILVSRHSAFYTPLIATIAGGFLKAEGLEARYGVLPPKDTSRHALAEGRAHLVQSAVSSNWSAMEKGIGNLPVHFAQINSRDGFFLAAREPDAAFHWKKLEGKSLIADHAGQPLAMLRYAGQLNGLDWRRVNLLDRGSPDQMEAAFRQGEGDYVHLQGPAPQQLEREGLGATVVSVGQSMPPVAFSSLTALPQFLDSAPGQAFLRAFGGAKRWAVEQDARVVAAAGQSFFPGIHSEALANAVRRYQELGCWHGGTAIPRDLYEQALDVFAFAGILSARHPYESVVRPID